MSFNTSVCPMINRSHFYIVLAYSECLFNLSQSGIVGDLL